MLQLGRNRPIDGALDAGFFQLSHAFFPVSTIQTEVAGAACIIKSGKYCVALFGFLQVSQKCSIVVSSRFKQG